MLVALGKPRPSQRDWMLAEAALSSPTSTGRKPCACRGLKVQAMLAWNLKSREAVYARLPKNVRTELTTAVLCARARRVQYTRPWRRYSMNSKPGKSRSS